MITKQKSQKDGNNELEFLRCIHCGKVIREDRFNKSDSHMFAGNKGRTPYCKECISDLYMYYYDHYFKDINKAIYRMCQLLDIYYSDEIVALTVNAAKEEKTRMGKYIQRCSLRQYNNKTFDTTLDEIEADVILDKETDLDSIETKVTKKMIKRWGIGLNEAEYLWLDNEYNRWVENYGCKGINEETMFKRICRILYEIENPLKDNKQRDIAKYDEEFRKYLHALKLQPNQVNSEMLGDQKPLGVLIKEWEENEPIRLDDKYIDYDNILLTSDLFMRGGILVGIKGMSEEEVYSPEELKLIDKWTAKVEEIVLNENENSEDFDESFNNWIDDEDE